MDIFTKLYQKYKKPIQSTSAVSEKKEDDDFALWYINKFKNIASELNITKEYLNNNYETRVKYTHFLKKGKNDLNDPYNEEECDDDIKLVYESFASRHGMNSGMVLNLNDQRIIVSDNLKKEIYYILQQPELKKIDDEKRKLLDIKNKLKKEIYENNI